MTVDVKINEPGIKRKVADNCFIAQQALDDRVAADSNYFCPMDTGALKNSVFPVMGTGMLEWNEPYAKEQYYTDNRKSADSNPNAASKWFEHAKARNRKEWEAVANAEYNS